MNGHTKSNGWLIKTVVTLAIVFALALAVVLMWHAGSCIFPEANAGFAEVEVVEVIETRVGEPRRTSRRAAQLRETTSTRGKEHDGHLVPLVDWQASLDRARAAEAAIADARDAEIEAIRAAIETLQPSVGDARGRSLALLIYDEAHRSKIDARLVVAVAYRESSFARAVEEGRRVGALGEVGLMQVMPRGTAERRHGDGCDQRDAACSIKTGVRYLADCRTKCGDRDPWVWVAAYARRACPSPSAARGDKAAKRARRLLCTVEPECESIWPAR